MTMDINLKPLEIKVEIKDYGIFYVRRIGAATEAVLQDQFAQVQKQLNDIQKNNADLIAKETKFIHDKNVQALEKLRATVEYQELLSAQKAVESLLSDVTRQANKVIMECWRSDVDGALDKLLNDLTMGQLKSAYQKIIAEADNA